MARKVTKTGLDLRALCRCYTEKTVQIMGGLATNENVPPGVRVQAIIALWERGWGKPPQSHTGEDGDGPIVVEIVYRNRDEREGERPALAAPDTAGERSIEH